MHYWHEYFSYEIMGNFQNVYFTEHLWVSVSDILVFGHNPIVACVFSESTYILLYTDLKNQYILEYLTRECLKSIENINLPHHFYITMLNVFQTLVTVNLQWVCWNSFNFYLVSPTLDIKYVEWATKCFQLLCLSLIQIHRSRSYYAEAVMIDFKSVRRLICWEGTLHQMKFILA